ncbi:MAG: Uma2 family endonuclease [Bryobacteraceae bacterium]
MSTATLVSLEEYLATTYRPDCDYLDGVLVERNVGQKDHSKLQGQVFAWFWIRRASLRLAVFPEQRIRVAPRRFRIPDVCVVTLPEPEEQIFTQPPYICTEILSPEDTFPRLQECFDDYVAMGVPNIWVLDPASRRSWRITRAGHLEALDGVLRTEDGRVSMPVAELFEAGA